MASVDALITQFENIQKTYLQKLQETESLEDLEALRVEIFGKKGQLTEITKTFGSLSAQDRPVAGQKANDVRAALQAEMDRRTEAKKLEAFNKKLSAEKVDVSLPGTKSRAAVLEHPVLFVQEELSQILGTCGFVTETGPEIEHEFYNFDSLNFPANHPARTMHDTFYVAGAEKIVLRTHTSPVQIRAMLGQQPPIRMIAPGRVYRSDYDATHSPMFHQIEGLLVDENVHMGHLKGILSVMIEKFFSHHLELRLRPSFFPFTEPSAEVDMQCVFCLGKGCSVCKKSGWVEIGGCGMVDPEVFKSVGFDPEQVRGFAFGMGIERMAMLKYGINDLRAFFESDHRFVSQFARWRA